MRQFLADSPWDRALLVRACAERVVPEIGVEAWVLDDTGFPKDGKHSPGVKRQYSGTLGKIGNCQLGVSVHAVGERGTVPLGWALYLPEEWCADDLRRKKAKIPVSVSFKTKPELGVDLVERAAGWGLHAVPVLGDHAYGENTALRGRLHDAGREYVLAVGAATTVFSLETVFAVPEQTAGTGRPKSRPAPTASPKRSATGSTGWGASGRGGSASATAPTASRSDRGSCSCASGPRTTGSTQHPARPARNG